MGSSGSGKSLLTTQCCHAPACVALCDQPGRGERRERRTHRVDPKPGRHGDPIERRGPLDRNRLEHPADDRSEQIASPDGTADPLRELTQGTNLLQHLIGLGDEDSVGHGAEAVAPIGTGVA